MVQVDYSEVRLPISVLWRRNAWHPRFLEYRAPNSKGIKTRFRALPIVEGPGTRSNCDRVRDVNVTLYK